MGEAATRRAEGAGEDAVATRSSQALLEFQQRRKASSRERLLAAATRAFCADGYLSVSVEDIASSAGVSRMTFYRHFSGKAALAAELFRLSAEAAMPDYLAVAQRDYRDRQVVADWIAGLFAGDRARGSLLRVFLQANVLEAGFTQKAHEFIDDLIAGLGASIPAFAFTEDERGRRRWIEAWLLLYELLDQSNHAALGRGVATNPLMIEILADKFLAFLAAREAEGVRS